MPYVPDENPTADHRLRFDHPGWDAERVLLRFDGVESVYRVWLNGTEIGIGKGSRLVQEFDVTEISMSSSLPSLARNDSHYVAIPAFVSRLFRHSSIYIRTDRGIKTAADLKGKQVGVPEYQMTANVWVRGMLLEEYGVHPRDIKWRRGGLEE